ncbi:hypothetical protein JL09_g6521, partial [Pichia kudriavzevii]
LNGTATEWCCGGHMLTLKTMNSFMSSRWGMYAIITILVN